MKNKIVTLSQLKKILKAKPGKKIVFTNGCFDILHSGHVQYLKKAKTKGDLLIVGLNSDASVRKIKGPARPVNNQKDRALVLAALCCIDYVVIFTQQTPYGLISSLVPDVLVKGGDWPKDKIVGSDIVLKNRGKVLNLPYIKDHSTSALAKKIQRL